jgi:hypothetical protein
VRTEERASTAEPIEQRHAVRLRIANEGVHEPFLLASLAVAVLGGSRGRCRSRLTLDRLGIGWLAHAEVHVHLQVVGFAGLCVVGVASRVGPRFAGRRINEGLLRTAFSLLVAGLLGPRTGAAAVAA